MSGWTAGWTAGWLDGWTAGRLDVCRSRPLFSISFDSIYDCYEDFDRKCLLNVSFEIDILNQLLFHENIKKIVIFWT
jgi:hypothetical protein